MPMKLDQFLCTKIEGEPRAVVVEHILPLAALAVELLTQRLHIKRSLQSWNGIRPQGETALTIGTGTPPDSVPDARLFFLKRR